MCQSVRTVTPLRCHPVVILSSRIASGPLLAPFYGTAGLRPLILGLWRRFNQLVGHHACKKQPASCARASSGGGATLVWIPTHPVSGLAVGHGGARAALGPLRRLEAFIAALVCSSLRVRLRCVLRLPPL